MKADRILEDLGKEFEVVEQEEETLTCDDAAKARGVKESEIVKSLIVEKDGEYIHVLLPGDRELSEKKFGEYSFADEEKSEELTGFQSGTVHPLSTELEHFIDRRVFEQERLSFTVGEAARGVIIDTEQFREAVEELGFEYHVGDYVLTNEEDIEELTETGLDKEEATFIANKGLTEIYRELVNEHSVDRIVKALMELNREDIDPEKELIELLLNRAESQNHLQKLVHHYAENGELPEEQEGFDLEQTVDEVLDTNSEAVEDYKDGKTSALNYLMGQVMEETNGRADGGKTREYILEKLDD